MRGQSRVFCASTEGSHHRCARDGATGRGIGRLRMRQEAQRRLCEEAGYLPELRRREASSTVRRRQGARSGAGAGGGGGRRCIGGAVAGEGDAGGAECVACCRSYLWVEGRNTPRSDAQPIRRSAHARTNAQRFWVREAVEYGAPTLPAPARCSPSGRADASTVPCF